MAREGMTAAQQQSGRRWLRISLRTLFLVVTLCACWLAYYANWIHQRRALLNDRNVAVSFTPERRQPSFGLWLMGERGATTVFLEYNGWMGGTPDEAQKKLAMRLYPEAEIELWGGTIMPFGHPGSHLE
jgi:hypothetical protein